MSAVGSDWSGSAKAGSEKGRTLVSSISSALGRRTVGLAARIARARQQAGDRAHARGDAAAAANGWTVSVTGGPLGLAGRTYRDPRFDALGAAVDAGRPQDQAGLVRP